MAAYLVQFLKQCVQVRSVVLQPWHRTGYIAEQVVIDHGGHPASGLGAPVATTPTLAPGMRLGQPRMCFANAHRAATADLLYTEGWAATDGAGGVPIHHAWLTTDDGRIYDPTWANDFAGRPAHYLGVRFSQEFVRQHRALWGANTVLERNVRLLEHGLAFDHEHIATDYAGAASPSTY